MAELKGYTCDGGCGSSTMLERSHETVTRNGWFMVFGPDGFTTSYACSAVCLIRLVARHSGLALGRELGP